MLIKRRNHVEFHDELKRDKEVVYMQASHEALVVTDKHPYRRMSI